MAASDVLVLPTLWEGLGTVLLSEFVLKFTSVTGSSSVEAVFLQTGAVDPVSLVGSESIIMTTAALKQIEELLK